MAQCVTCGASLKPGATRCVKCGTIVDVVAAPGASQPTQHSIQSVPTQTALQPKSKAVAALLAFFLGTFGIHNFYLGYTGRGLAQLLITVLTLGSGIIVTGIWAFIEFILILTGLIKDKFGRPLT